MSNKLIADLMSFRARMVADNRTQLMFEGDFDTIDQAIATLRKPPIAAPQQAIPSERIAKLEKAINYLLANDLLSNSHARAVANTALLSASPTAPIERDK
jgi:hypothetical protein